MSLFISIPCMACAALLTRQEVPTWQVPRTVPAIYWFGGLGGAIFLTTSTFALSRLGAATCVALALPGQLIMSAAVDHFGLFGLPQKAVDLQGMAGITHAAAPNGHHLMRKLRASLRKYLVIGADPPRRTRHGLARFEDARSA